MNFVTRWLPLIAYMAVLTVASLGSTLPGEGRVVGIQIDKVYHAGAYAVLGVLVARIVSPSLFVKKGFLGAVAVVVVTTIACLLFGAVLELLQYLTPLRAASLLDTAADGIGGIAGAVLFAAFAWLRKEKPLAKNTGR